jgi:hypothetical protein
LPALASDLPRSDGYRQYRNNEAARLFVAISLLDTV